MSTDSTDLASSTDRTFIECAKWQKEKEKQKTGDAQVASKLRDDKQKEQKKEFQEIQKETEYLLNIEASYGCDLLHNIRTSFIHCIKPENVLICIPKYDSRVLAIRDVQEIRCVTERKGDIAGAECLLDHVGRHKGWLPCLLKVLRDPMVLQDHLADDIEKAVELLREGKKKRDSTAHGRADGTFMINKETEGADHYTDQPQTTTFGSLDTYGKPKYKTVTKITSWTVHETWTSPTTDTCARGTSLKADPLKTPINPETPDLTADTKANLRQRFATENKRQIDVLLVGKTGNGKSSAGNSILLKEAFEMSDDMTSCTKAAQFDYSEFDGVIFKVVDGPGLGDTDLNGKDAFIKVQDAMSEAIAMNAEGYHAILVVVRYGGKFTEEEVITLETMKAIFGEGFIKDHAILVMTYGDNFHKNAKKRKDTFEKWCKRQEGVFKRLVAEVENRVVLFDNMAEDNRIRYGQLQQLVKVIDGLSGKGKRYNNEMFEKAKESRDRALVEFKQPILHESILLEAAIISKRFYEINLYDVGKAYECLQTLLERAHKLEKCIKEQDMNTGALSLSITFAEDLKRFIEAEIESICNIITGDRQEKNEVAEDKKEKRGKVFESVDQERKRIGADRRVNHQKEEITKGPEQLVRKGKELQGVHTKKAVLVEKSYRNIKEKRTSVLAKIGITVRKLLFSPSE